MSNVASKKLDKKVEIEKLIVLLGGADNISTATHCVSRLRLVMRDMKLVDSKQIEELGFVKGTMKLPNNQYHVVIGAGVEDYFKVFSEVSNIKKSSKEEVKMDAASSGNRFQRALQHFAEIFIPIIPVLVAAGIILGVRNIFEADFDGWKMVDHSQFIAGLNSFLWYPAEAGLWFLPVYIVWSIFKKMGGSPVLGIVIGISLMCSSHIIYNFQGSGIQWIWDLPSSYKFDFGMWKFPWDLSYMSQVLPAIGVGFLGVYLERWLKNVTTPVLRQIIVPLFTILGAYTAGMVIIGPLGWVAGSAISVAVKWALTNSIARYFFGPIFGLLYAPLVVTGMHHMLNAVMIQNAGSIGGTILFPILAISNTAQGAATLMYGIMHRKDEKIKQVAYPATTSSWLGVTEPAMYGINLKYMFPFFAAIFGSALGSLFIVISGTAAAGIGNGSWLGVLSIEAKSQISGYHTWGGSLGHVWFLIAMAIATISAMILTPVFAKMPLFKKWTPAEVNVKFD